MMVVILLVAISMVAAAPEYPQGKMLQLCGAELARAVKICKDGDLDFFNTQHVQKHHHSRDHEHDHNHEHNHNHEQHEWKSHATKRNASYSLVDECCAKPCPIEEFLSYCK